MVSVSEVQQDVSSAFLEVKSGAAKYLIAESGEDTIVKLSAKGGADATMEDLRNDIAKDSPRFVIYNLKWDADDGRKISKIVFIMWSPDACTNVKDKMLYASLKDSFRATCEPINKEYQVNDMLDLKDEELIGEF